VRRQRRDRFYNLSSAEGAGLLERLSGVARGKREPLACGASPHLRAARTCYDHVAGIFGVALRDRFTALGWLTVHVSESGETYEVSPNGASAFTSLGIDLEATRSLRRRFAFGCLDCTERRYHVGGALGAALLRLALTQKWVAQDVDSRALRVTEGGSREILGRLWVPHP
jgi:hypothetical protein